MVVHELTAGECRRLLARTHIGRLACARRGQPYIVPILFYFDDETDHVYSFSMVGRKVEWMRTNPLVCLEVDEIVDRFHWTTVVALGRYEEITDIEQARAARRRARELFQPHGEWWLPGAAQLASGQEHGTTVVYRIRIDALSGRRTSHERPM